MSFNGIPATTHPGHTANVTSSAVARKEPQIQASNPEQQREARIQMAATFLVHPAVKGGEWAQQRNFLVSKGLSEEEMLEARYRCEGHEPPTWPVQPLPLAGEAAAIEPAPKCVQPIEVAWPEASVTKLGLDAPVAKVGKASHNQGSSGGSSDSSDSSNGSTSSSSSSSSAPAVSGGYKQGGPVESLQPRTQLSAGARQDGAAHSQPMRLPAAERTRTPSRIVVISPSATARQAGATHAVNKPVHQDRGRGASPQPVKRDRSPSRPVVYRSDMDLWPPGMSGVPLTRPQRLELMNLARFRGRRLQECARDLAEADRCSAQCIQGAEKETFQALCEDLRAEQHRLTAEWSKAAAAAAGAANHSAEGVRPVYVQGERLFCAAIDSAARGRLLGPLRDSVCAAAKDRRQMQVAAATAVANGLGVETPARKGRRRLSQANSEESLGSVPFQQPKTQVLVQTQPPPPAGVCDPRPQPRASVPDPPLNKEPCFSLRLTKSRKALRLDLEDEVPKRTPIDLDNDISKPAQANGTFAASATADAAPIGRRLRVI